MEKVFIFCLALVAVVYASSPADKNAQPKLHIGIKKRIDPENCPIRAKNGDTLHMNYKGFLDNGKMFDSSYDRNEPFSFKLGSGQVIKGWDQGLLNMCEGEQRKLIIPSVLGYGSHGAPPTIPPDATLTFEVELVKIDRQKSDL